MDPYETDVSKVPSSDLYRHDFGYGRYRRLTDDFEIDRRRVGSTTPEALTYWAQVLEKCTTDVRMYENDEHGRDVFALGTVIVKSSHLRSHCTRDHTLADMNEVAAIDLARKPLLELAIQVPEILFAAKVRVAMPRL